MALFFPILVVGMVCPKLKKGMCIVLRDKCGKNYIAKVTGICPMNKPLSGGRAARKKAKPKASAAKKGKAKKQKPKKGKVGKKRKKR